MQQPLSLPDDSEDAQPIERLDAAHQPMPGPLPFPGGEAPQAPGSIEIDAGDLAFPGSPSADTHSGPVSQRELIMQQQRDIVRRQAGLEPGQPAPSSTQSVNGPAAPAGNRWLTRRSAWAALVIGLTTLVISGGFAATGQTGPLDQVASALTPDFVERWLGENISAFGDNAEAPQAATALPVATGSSLSPAALAPATAAPDAPPPAAQPLRAQIANTGGVGVSVRAICINEARTPAALDEGTAVRIIGRGVGDCSGWSVVRAGARTSWVEDRFLSAAATP